ncbi:MAG: SH3 domain-containing protein [Bdellovibrionales bacterium]|nr:SH3 domain-containing protein [Bdellovibrionales bacterium]
MNYEIPHSDAPLADGHQLCETQGSWLQSSFIAVLGKVQAQLLSGFQQSGCLIKNHPKRLIVSLVTLSLVVHFFTATSLLSAYQSANEYERTIDDIKQELSDSQKRQAQITNVLKFLVSTTNPPEEPPQRHTAPVVQETLPPAETITLQVKANLRTGPGLEFEPAMKLAKGSRLVVQGYDDGWYSIMAPTGERLWVSQEVVK